MKKYILTQILIFSFFFSIAQQKKNNPASFQSKSTSVSSSPAIIGQTTYDLQNYGSARRQSYYYPNGTVGAAFNFDQSYSFLVSPYTAYNYFDGSTWGPIAVVPDTISFASLDRLSNGNEVVVGYDAAAAGGLRLDTNNAPGSGNWAGIALPPEPNGHKCNWPHIAVGGANGMSIHVVALTEPVAFGGFSYSGVDGMLTYSRSEDGGATWNITYATLPGWNSSVTARMYPDEYTIDAKGTTVAITAGGRTNDWVMWKSTDNGNTFTKTTIKSFPIPAYDEFTMISDTNSDGIADSLLVPDGSMAVLIDNNGLVHCWSGDVGIVDSFPASMFKYKYRYSDGLNYWNENMGAALPVVITPPVNLNNIQNLGQYGVGVASMPTAGVDMNNKIYVCLSYMLENTTNGVDQSYRNLLAMYSSNSGALWSAPSFLEQDLFGEQVFPYMARNVDSTLKIIYQEDAEPGMAVMGDLDPFVLNEIYYLEPDTALYGTGPFMGYVSGQIYFDENNNNVFDGIDNNASAILITVNQTGTWNSYYYNGIYYTGLFYGNNLIEPYGLPSYFSSTPANASYIVTTPSNYTQDFALQAIAPYDSATVFIDSYDEYCFAQADYLPIINNYGTTTKNYVLKFHPDPVLPSPVYVNPAPDSVVNGDYYFSVNGLHPLEQNDSINLSIVTPGPGVSVTTYADLYENNLGVLTYVHSDTISKVISCSYDPNDKTAKPEGIGPQHYTLLNQNLEYVIRFQNTGNDTAFNVMILDTLDANFDVSTFQLLHASHPCTVEILPGNILRFHFNNIHLPDSNVNEPASHGFIHYRIKPLSGTSVNTVVYNTANIYFDFNLPVATNTTFNTLVNVIPSGIDLAAGFQNEINIIPNPFSASTQLNFNNDHHDVISIDLLDVSGRVIKTFSTADSKFILDAAAIEKGIYILQISNPSKQEVQIAKLVKE